jgi:hypothetical protein
VPLAIPPVRNRLEAVAGGTADLLGAAAAHDRVQGDAADRRETAAGDDVVNRRTALEHRLQAAALGHSGNPGAAGRDDRGTAAIDRRSGRDAAGVDQLPGAIVAHNGRDRQAGDLLPAIDDVRTGIDRGAARRTAARDDLITAGDCGPLARPNTVWEPPLIRPPLSVPPALTITNPLSWSPIARPPDEITKVPRPNVLLATPPEAMYTMPPFMFVAIAVPPVETISLTISLPTNKT